MTNRGGTQVLPPHMRQALSNLSNRIFMQKSPAYDNFQSNFPGNEIVTSLPLQMTMYFNVIIFPFWFSTYCVMLDVKYPYLSGTYRVVQIAVLVLFTLIEVIRLYLGYMGNLQEKVPELAGFLLLTILLQLPLLLFLLCNPSTLLLPMEGVMHAILTLMTVIEIFTAFFTASAMTNQQATKFHLQQFIDLDNINTPLAKQELDEIGQYNHGNTISS